MDTFLAAQQIDIDQSSRAAAGLYERVVRSMSIDRLDDGLSEVWDGLHDVRDSSDPADWRAFAAAMRREDRLRELLHQDPFTRRAFEKPRGYAGDAVMMDYLYGVHSYHTAAAGASELGREIFRFARTRPAARAVCYRREHIAQLIDRTAAAVARPNILAIAAGHLREAERSSALADGLVGRLVALDADAESLREVEARYGRLGVETIHASVRHILAGKLRIGAFDFVYAAGLYDYLSDPVAGALTSRLFEIVNPGGELFIPNFVPSCRDRAFMEAFMNWDLIYRDEYDMSRLVESLPAAHVASYDIYRDPSDSIVYLRVKKARLATS